jgi:acyl carrier protein
MRAGFSGVPAQESVVVDIAAEVRDILVFHLGSEEASLTDDARLADDLGADRLDVVEVAMSCEERFGIDIPNHVAATFVTVGDAVDFIEAQLAAADDTPDRPVPPSGHRFRLKLAFVRHLLPRTLVGAS